MAELKRRVIRGRIVRRQRTVEIADSPDAIAAMIAGSYA